MNPSGKAAGSSKSENKAQPINKTAGQTRPARTSAHRLLDNGLSSSFDGSGHRSVTPTIPSGLHASQHEAYERTQSNTFDVPEVIHEEEGRRSFLDPDIGGDERESILVDGEDFDEDAYPEEIFENESTTADNELTESSPQRDIVHVHLQLGKYGNATNDRFEPNVKAARQKLKDQFEDILQKARDEISQGTRRAQRAASRAFRHLLYYANRPWLAQHLVEYVPSEVALILAKEDLDFADLVSLPRQSPQRHRGWGCYMNLLSNIDNRRVYVGSSIATSRPGMLNRSRHYDAIIAGLSRAESRHERALAREGTTTEWRVLSCFPGDVHPGFVRLLETIWMTYFRSIERLPVYPKHPYCTVEGFEAYESIAVAVKERPWKGLNDTWPLSQGVPHPPKDGGFSKQCMICRTKTQSRTSRFKAADGQLWDSYRCENCHNWRKWNGTERPDHVWLAPNPGTCEEQGCMKEANQRDPQDSYRWLCKYHATKNRSKSEQVEKPPKPLDGRCMVVGCNNGYTHFITILGCWGCNACYRRKRNEIRKAREATS